MCDLTLSPLVYNYVQALRQAIVEAVQRLHITAAPKNAPFVITPHAEVQLKVSLDHKHHQFQQELKRLPDLINYEQVQPSTEFHLTHDETILYFFDVEGVLDCGKLTQLDVTLATDEKDFIEFLQFRGWPAQKKPNSPLIVDLSQE